MYVHVQECIVRFSAVAEGRTPLCPQGQMQQGNKVEKLPEGGREAVGDETVKEKEN